MALEVHDHYRVSQRVTLVSGDQFRAKGGPYWLTTGGMEYSMAAKGPFTFRKHCVNGDVEWIEGSDRDGNHCHLHLAGERRTVDLKLIPRPYVVGSKIRKKSSR